MEPCSQPLTSRVDSTVPGSRKGVVQKASMTGTLGSRWYVTMRCSSARLASSRGSVSSAVDDIQRRLLVTALHAQLRRRGHLHTLRQRHAVRNGLSGVQFAWH